MNERISQCREFILVTDGSGWKDGIGGYCAVVYSHTMTKLGRTMSATDGTDTYREEFKGLLAGLELIYRNNPCVGMGVYWFGDNESLVKGVQRHYKDRRKHADLWHMLEFFEDRYSIVAEQIPRTDPRIAEADLHASACRVIMKNYIDGITT